VRRFCLSYRQLVSNRLLRPPSSPLCPPACLFVCSWNQQEGMERGPTGEDSATMSLGVRASSNFAAVMPLLLAVVCCCLAVTRLLPACVPGGPRAAPD
jgi:hypothetical protein